MELKKAFIYGLLATMCLWIGATLVFWSAFEYCLQAGADPYRFPPHHFWTGMILEAIGWFLIISTLFCLLSEVRWIRRGGR